MFNYNLDFRVSILNKVTNFFVFQTVQASSTTLKSPTKKNRGGSVSWSKGTEAGSLIYTLSNVVNIDTGAAILVTLLLEHTR